MGCLQCTIAEQSSFTTGRKPFCVTLLFFFYLFYITCISIYIFICIKGLVEIPNFLLVFWENTLRTENGGPSHLNSGELYRLYGTSNYFLLFFLLVFFLVVVVGVIRSSNNFRLSGSPQQPLPPSQLERVTFMKR